MTDNSTTQDGLRRRIAELEAEAKALRREAQRAVEIVETAPDALLVVDSRGRIVSTNRQAEGLFGYRRSEILDEPLELLLPERYREGHEGNRRHYFGQPKVRAMGSGLELYARRADGSEFPVEISLSPIQIGEETLVVSAIRDATERRDIERRLQSARTKAEAATAEKTRFIAAASHDLRQPLQAAAIYLDLLADEVLEPDRLPATARKAKDCVDSLRTFLDKVLHISRLDAGAVTAQRRDFRLQPLFDRVESQFQPLALSKGLDLRIRPTRESVASDPILAGQILKNLVSNALRYTHEGGVLVGCRRRGDGIVLQVWDTGVGIAESELANVFRAFYQVEGSGESAAGIGLGLAIVGQISGLLGHPVEVRSRPGAGSVFEVTLPRAAAILEAPQAAPRPIPRNRSALLAVLDNSPAIVDALATVLEVAGNRVVSATSVDELLAGLREAGRVPDAFLTDFRLTAGATGLDALARLRREFATTVPAIVLTGDSSFEALRRRAPTDDFRVLAKPVDAKQLLLEIERCLGP